MGLRWSCAIRFLRTQKNADNAVCVPLRTWPFDNLDIKIHLELERVWPHPNGIDLLRPFVTYPPLYESLGEHIALQHEVVIGFERVEGPVERARQGRHVLQLFR